MGIKKSYIRRAFNVYERNFGSQFILESTLEIVVRLQKKDELKKCRKSTFSASNNSVKKNVKKTKLKRSASLRDNFNSFSNNISIGNAHHLLTN